MNFVIVQVLDKRFKVYDIDSDSFIRKNFITHELAKEFAESYTKPKKDIIEFINKETIIDFL